MLAWRVLQLADSAFPTGGFAHSAGLEAAVQLGEVRGAAGLRAFVTSALWQTGFGALPLARAAHAGDLSFGDVDATCDAFLTNAVANRASRTQGRAFVATASRVFDARALGDLHASIRAATTPGHFAPVFGAALRALDVPLAETARLVVFGALRAVVSAGVRLGVVGPHDAQRIESESFATCDRVLAECGALDLDSLAQPAPTLDIIAGAHDRLYARLFQS